MFRERQWMLKMQRYHAFRAYVDIWVPVPIDSRKAIFLPHLQTLKT